MSTDSAVYQSRTGAPLYFQVLAPLIYLVLLPYSHHSFEVVIIYGSDKLYKTQFLIFVFLGDRRFIMKSEFELMVFVNPNFNFV